MAEKLQTKYVFFVIDLIVGLEVKLLRKYCLNHFDNLRHFINHVNINGKQASSSLQNLVGFFQD
jgi:hypothetical protein